jgi:NADH-quinone oxidoreductase subunit C
MTPPAGHSDGEPVDGAGAEPPDRSAAAAGRRSLARLGVGLLGQPLADAVAEAADGGVAGAVASVDGAGTACVDVPRERWAAVARQLREGFGMDFLDWLSAADQPDADPAGVDVVLHVADSTRAARRVLLRTRVPDADLCLPSLTGVWPGAAWHERETFEMFGVEFTGFDDGSGHGLRPLLLPEGFEGTPLRKSFMLAARAVKPWPGGKEPGESHAGGAPSRRKVQPPGVPDPQTWGPREPAPRPGDDTAAGVGAAEEAGDV